MVKRHSNVLLLRAVKRLLDYKDVDPNRPDEDDRTPLKCAAVEGRVRVVTLLLGWEDADTDRPDENAWTLLGCAALGGHLRPVRLLQASCERITTKHEPGELNRLRSNRVGFLLSTATLARPPGA